MSSLRVNCLVTAFFFWFAANAQTFYRTMLTTPLQEQGNDSIKSRDLEAEKKYWKEIPEKRTLTSSTYITPSGSVMTEYCARPINYYRDGNLVPINSSLHADENGWIANDQPYPVRVNKEGSFETTTESGAHILFGAGAMINDVTAETGTTYFNEHAVVFKDVVPGIDRQIDVHENRVKYNYVIPQPLTFSGQYTTITDECWMPRGVWIYFDSTSGEWKDDIWYGDIVIRNTSGREQARLHRPLCFDAAGNVVEGGYKMERNNYDSGIAPWMITVYVPNAWLNDASRDFPIVIDPLVTGPTANYTGGQVPSCLAPAYGQDSILVTIPGQITVTALYVTCNYYAVSPAVMADGSMYFSTDCNQTQLFIAQPPNAQLPGTAYLTAFDMRSPLTCCWPQQCAQQQFWLSMHIGRSQWGTGCNTQYVYYDPFSLWPFTAYIEGHTVEYFSSGWFVPNTPICTDQCTITGTAQIRYGVPPYTFTHPWMVGSTTGSAAAGCSFGNINKVLTLTNPDCPLYCDTVSSLMVGPPIVVDACGNMVQGLPIDFQPLKPVPIITATPDTQFVCPDMSTTIVNTSCISNTIISWSNGDTTGTGSFSGMFSNTGTTDTTINFTLWGVTNGCYSDTIAAAVTVVTNPTPAFTTIPSPVIAGAEMNFIDQSATSTGTITGWNYQLPNDLLTTQNPPYTFNTPGMYPVCFTVTTGYGCEGQVCDSIEVIPAEVHAPNVITPNDDGINDLLVFEFLEFYPDNDLMIYDRWGMLIYTQHGYANDWDGRKYSDGTYYYVLNIADREGLTGFFQLIK